MILDTIDNADFYKKLSKNIEKAFDFLEKVDLNALKEGRHEIEGDEVYALVLDYSTSKETLDNFEAHRRYFDLQFIVHGAERVSVAKISEMTPINEYVDEHDYQLFKGKGTKLVLSKNDFIILGPKDVHQPGILIEKEKEMVKKVVVKVKI